MPDTCSSTPSFPFLYVKAAEKHLSFAISKADCALVSGNMYRLLSKLQRRHYNGILKNFSFLAETWIIIRVIG